MRQVLFSFFFFIAPVLLHAQQLDTPVITRDSTGTKDSIVTKDTAIAKDSAFARDSVFVRDSVFKKKSVIAPVVSYNISLLKILQENSFLNSRGKPAAMASRIRTPFKQERYFYLLALLTTLLAFFRFFYPRYFNNLFRVFFNASLRQSQLTDQLLQAKLPSLFFNILFVIGGGLYIYLLLRYFNWVSTKDFWIVLLYCIVSMAIIYLVKYLTLKFTGWLTGFTEVTNTYIFIIFLINKILGILLIPFLVIIAFSIPDLILAAVIISLLWIGLMFLLRFFRSYGLLQHKLKVSRTHFFLYVIGIEILPLLLIYKALVLLLSKNL